MMRFPKRALAVALLIAAVPALAGYKLVPHGESTYVAKSGLSVTPETHWNRLSTRVGRNAESWTLDGLSLNDLTFYGGIANDQTLFKEVDKKNRPLPHFNATMLAPDVAQLFEGSYRIANRTPLMSIDSIEPATFAGKPGFHFTYNFTIQDEEVKRKGEATGAIIGGQLFMITFEAPAIFYYDRDAPAYRKVAATAVIGPAPKVN